jgi:hypothetical protein
MHHVNWNWTSFRDIRPEGGAAEGHHNIFAARISRAGALNGVLIFLHTIERVIGILAIDMHSAVQLRLGELAFNSEDKHYTSTRVIPDLDQGSRTVPRDNWCRGYAGDHCQYGEQNQH